MYDEIANVYHLVYANWEEAIATQSQALDRAIKAELGPGAESVLDVACGIGTQALGLATLGYRVTASDLSEGAIRRAAAEARQRSLNVAFRVSDMRTCASVHGTIHDVVICCDNALPHLLSTEEIAIALSAFRRCLRPGGLALIGIRDYTQDQSRSAPEFRPYGFREDATGRYVVFQTWDWEGEHYDVGMYFVKEATSGAPPTVIGGRSRYFAIPVATLVELMLDAGFVEARRVDGVFYQPLVVARCPNR